MYSTQNILVPPANAGGITVDFLYKEFENKAAGQIGALGCGGF